jgi:alpha-L-fucosidase
MRTTAFLLLVSAVACLFLCSARYGSAAPAAASEPAARPAIVPLGPLPTPQQIAWQRGELTLFLHFGVNTFTDREWGLGNEDEKIFNPTRLDARQWVRAAKAGGFKTVILTAKHHDGFCLWPSKYTEHSVKNSPWRGGKGDVVRELADACRHEGLKLGLYLSPWDRHEKSYGDSPRYNQHYRNQLTELMSNYGPIAEVWFDGACGEGPNGKRQQYDWKSFIEVIRRLQPQAVIFSDAGPDIRWIGNEAGIAGDPCWAAVDPAVVPYPGSDGPGIHEMLQHGLPRGSVWRPGESDVSIRPGWFWHAAENDKVRSVDNLVDLYFKSVGRNSLLLLNVPPNQEGRLSDGDVRRLAEFHARLGQIFATDLAAGRPATASSVHAPGEAFAPGRAVDADADSYWAAADGQDASWLEVDLGSPKSINVVRIEEPIALGQRVEAFRLEALDAGQWRTVAEGSTIGHKRLLRFPAVAAQRVRLAIDKSLATPAISSFGLYYVTAAP